VTLLPDLFDGRSQLAAIRAALDTDHALVTMRARAAALLPALPRPLGFVPHSRASRAPGRSRQHGMGADPGPPSG
jgi:hypothetical protein